MSQSQVQNGKMIDFAAPVGGAVSGVAFLVGGMLVVPQTSAAAGEMVACSTEGVHEVAKEATAIFAAGDVAYWDDSAEKLDETASGSFGNCTVTEAAAASTTSVRVKLHGFSVVSEAQ